MRTTAPTILVKDIWNALTAEYGVAGSYGKLLEDYIDAKISEVHKQVCSGADPADSIGRRIYDYLDSKVSLAKADLTTLETRLSEARAGYLDNLNNAQLLNIPDLSTLTAARIGYLDNINQAGLLQLTSARAQALDNLDKAISTLPEVSIGVFPSTDVEKIDDITGDLAPTLSGTMTDYENLFDNDTGTRTYADEVGEYIQLAFKTPVVLIGYRFYKYDTAYGSPENAKVKIQYHNGSTYVDWVTGIGVEDTAGWTNWAFPDPVLAKGKYVRIVATGLDAQPRCTVNECELYGLCAYVQ